VRTLRCRARTESALLIKVWVLNLDAEIELSRSGPYQAPERVLRALAPWAERARSLLDADDQLLPTWRASAARPSAVGACWSPTPSALRQLSKAGVPLPPAPSVAVLRQVSHRRFYLGLGGGAPGAAYFADPDTLEHALAARGAAPWLFKRPYGFAGRGQRRIPERLSADDRRWLADGLRLGGLLGEPWLPIERELCLHGLLDARGQLRLGRPCEQHTDRFRAWTSSSVIAPGQLAAEWQRALTSAAERAAQALHQAGYFGPFGIDAYLWRTPGGSLELNPLGELNARYTMGFRIGMAGNP
jgi:ATP-grasp domain